MNIDRNYQLEKAASKDALRHSLNHILLEKDFAIATTGHILAKVPIENNSLAGLLDPKALTLARKMQKTPDLELHLRNGTVGVVAMDKHGAHSNESIEMKRHRLGEEEGVFPDWKAVIPKHENKRKFGFEVKYLTDLAAAMGTDKVVLEVDMDDHERGFIVRPFDRENKAAGLLMPIRINDHLSDKEMEAHRARRIEALERHHKAAEAKNNQNKENHDTNGNGTARETAEGSTE